ncbi:MAG: recombinase family protein [Alphaproteobacteria bacterium]
MFIISFTAFATPKISRLRERGIPAHKSSFSVVWRNGYALPIIHSGRLYIVDKEGKNEWVEPYINELVSFPHGRFVTYKDGRSVGGKSFSRGALYALLSNPIYIGQIRHKEKTYDGQHDGIIHLDLWSSVQEKLANQASVYKNQKISREVICTKMRSYRFKPLWQFFVQANLR